MPISLPFALKLNAIRFPTKPALVCGEHSWTYLELAHRVTGIASVLRDEGVGEGDVAAFLSINHPDMVAAMFAALELRAIPAPINYRISKTEIQSILEAAEPKIILYQSDLHDLLPDVGTKIDFAASAMDDELARKVAAAGNCGLPNEERLAPVLLHTSGTTGQPKGALRANWGFEERAIEHGFTPEDKFMAAHPLCLSTGWCYANMALYLGATVHLVEQFKASEAVDLIERAGITSTVMMGTLLQALTEAPEFKTANLSSLRVLLTGGGAIPYALRRQVYDHIGPILGVWAAATETGPYATLAGEALKAQTGESNCVGSIFFGVELQLRDDDGNTVSAGEVGEIFVRSPFQFDGYRNDIEATQETIKDGFISVGDLGRFDEEGLLHFVGRKRDIIKSGGMNVYATEVEAVIGKFPGVREVACVGLPDPKWVEKVVAVVVPEDGQSLDVEQLRKQCREILSGYKVPKDFVLTDALPRNLTGRVQKHILVQSLLENIENSSA